MQTLSPQPRSAEAIGRAAVEMLAGQIEGAAVSTDELFFEPEIVARGSTAAARVKLSAAEHAAAETTAGINEIVQDQNRLKTLLPAVGAGSDLQKRYLSKLDQEETQLDTLKATRAAREKARDDARRTVQDYIGGL